MSINSLSNSLFQNLPEDLLASFYTILDPHSAYALSQTNSVFKQIFASMQERLIPIQFGCQISLPSTQYYRLLCARSKNAEIVLGKNIIWEKSANCYTIANTKEFILTTPAVGVGATFVGLRTGEMIPLKRGKSARISCSCLKEPDLKRPNCVIIGFEGSSELEFWDLNERKCTQTLDAKDDSIAFRFWQISPDGKNAISAHFSEGPFDFFTNDLSDLMLHGVTLKIWDLDEKKIIGKLENLSICVYDLKMIANSEKFLTKFKSDDEDFSRQIIWDFSTGKSVEIPLNLPAARMRLKLTDDHSKALFISENRGIFCDLNTGKILHMDHESFIRAFTMNPKGTLCLTLSDNDEGNSKIKLWNLRTGECLKTFICDIEPMEQLEIDEAGSRFFMMSSNKTSAEIFDLNSGEHLQSFEYWMQGSFILAPCGKQAFCFDETGMATFNLTPLPIERVTQCAYYLSKNLNDEESESEEDEERILAYRSFERLSATVQAFIHNDLQTNSSEQDETFTLAGISNKEKLKSLLTYLYTQKEFILDILEQIKKISLADNLNERTICNENVISLIECLKLGSSILIDSELDSDIQNLFLQECFNQFKSSIDERNHLLIRAFFDVLKAIDSPRMTIKDEIWDLVMSLEERIGSDFDQLFLIAIFVLFQDAVIALKNNNPNYSDQVIQIANDLMQGSSKVKYELLQLCMNELKHHISSVARAPFLTCVHLEMIKLIAPDIHRGLFNNFDQFCFQWQQSPIQSIDSFIQGHLNIIEHFQTIIPNPFHPELKDELPYQRPLKRRRH